MDTFVQCQHLKNTEETNANIRQEKCRTRAQKEKKEEKKHVAWERHAGPERDKTKTEDEIIQRKGDVRRAKK